MITFEQEGTIVKAKVDTGAGYTIKMSFECSNSLFATLLRQQLQEKQYKETESFAKSNYDAGWSDKLKKQNKRTWHPSKI